MRQQRYVVETDRGTAYTHDDHSCRTGAEHRRKGSMPGTGTMREREGSDDGPGGVMQITEIVARSGRNTEGENDAGGGGPMRMVSFHDYVQEVLTCADYRKGSDRECIVAVAPVLPGCMTQGKNMEEARDNVIDAIELWITVGLRDGEDLPVVNGCRLASALEALEELREATVAHA